MPNLNFQFAEDHTRVDVGYALRTSSGINICLLQLSETVSQALDDAPRPIAVSVLRDLLVGGQNHPQPALQQMMPGGGPVLVVAPEYALGSGDWDEVDAIVRAANRPLVLVTGFGATVGQTVLNWQTAGAAGGTQRHLSWEQNHRPISGLMRVNGGWCWIHEPNGTTHCIAYLKNVLQQAYEAVNLPDMQTGETLLHLRFEDLDLLPLICADLVQPAAQNPASPQARIQRMLMDLDNDRPTLVMGSLLQIGFNQNWAIAIDSLLNNVLAERTKAVVLCNVAHDVPVANEDHDKWRSLSGVFAPYGEMIRGQASLPAVRALNAQGVVGAVVRQTHPSVTAGVVYWAPYNPVNGNFVWRGNMVCPIHDEGLASPVVTAPGKAACEIVRFLRRYPPDPGSAPRLDEGIMEIGEQLWRSALPAPDFLLTSTLDGTSSTKPIDPDALGEAELISALRTGLHALATLKSIDGIEWQTGHGMAGQLRLNAQDRHILVWRSSSQSPRALKRHLSEWRLNGDVHPHLVVFGSTRMGDLADGEIEADRRDDISIAPAASTDLSAGGSLAAASGDITVANGVRRVAGLALSHVAEIYADYDPAEDSARVTALLDRVGAFFQE